MIDKSAALALSKALEMKAKEKMKPGDTMVMDESSEDASTDPTLDEDQESKQMGIDLLSALKNSDPTEIVALIKSIVKSCMMGSE